MGLIGLAEAVWMMRGVVLPWGDDVQQSSKGIRKRRTLSG